MAEEPSNTPEKSAPKRKPGGILNAFLPNQAVSPTVMKMIVAVQIVGFLLVWIFSPFEVLPKPTEVFTALQNLWFKGGLAEELLVSFSLNLKAILITSLISLGFAYLTVLPFFRPIVAAVSKGRFLSMVGFTFVFTLIVGGGGNLKLALLVFGMTVFFLTSMASVVTDIPREKFDHARSLRMSEWRTVWEVVIVGTIDQAFEVLRQNAAIGWLMLTMVEGIVRSEGGIGALLLNEQKHFALPAVFAIQIVILIIGLCQDYLIGVIRKLVCPYADLTTERSKQ